MVTIGVSQNADPLFLADQPNLTIVMKDGYSFFKANAELITRRLANPDKKTTIIMVHPDSPEMASIAKMDPHKTTESQQSDCLQAVQLLHTIRADIFAEDPENNIEERVVFVGHNHIPTWNGFIADHWATVNFYTTQPQRGKLPSISCSSHEGFIAPLIAECKEFVASAAAAQNGTTSESPVRARNLWGYQVPANLQDKRL